MISLRKKLYPRNWHELAQQCKELAQWRCERCHIKQGSWRKSKRTGLPYRVWLHAAHVRLHDTFNPRPALMCLCPTCHGRYDYRLRMREAYLFLEILKHRYLLQQQGYNVAC